MSIGLTVQVVLMTKSCAMNFVRARTTSDLVFEQSNCATTCGPAQDDATACMPFDKVDCSLVESIRIWVFVMVLLALPVPGALICTACSHSAHKRSRVAEDRAIHRPLPMKKWHCWSEDR
eukprot:5101735-Amphidinium_carterae.1